MTHRRWYCPECRRQWLYANRWIPGSNCPACGGQYVQQVDYDAPFPGGDYQGAIQVPLPEPERRAPAVERNAALLQGSLF